MLLKRFIPGCVLVLVACASFAQDVFDQKIVNMALVRIPAVTKELKIGPDQTRKLAAIQTESNTALDKLNKGKTPPTPTQVSDVAKAARAKSVAVLSASQLKRLREITLQTLGPLGVLNADIQAKLNVSKTQKPKLAGLMKTFAPKMAAAAKPKDPKAKPTEAELKQRVAAIDKVQKELATAVRAILTPAQLKQYRTLVGKPCPGLRVAARVPL